MVKATIDIWERLIGPAHKFSAENRTVNAVGIISLCLLFLLYPVNFIINLEGSAVVATVLIVMQSVLYYLSRYKKKYRLSMIIYASFSYLALVANYRYNSGINGPTVFLFFLSFQLLIAITPKTQHKIWGALHLFIGLILLLLEYYYPTLVQNTYESRAAKFFDIGASYVISLSFIYIITNYLLNKYGKEKKRSDERYAAIEEQNKALKDIAWMQSHKVRNHVATILGLAEVWNVSSEEENRDKIVSDIKCVATELDNVIREINRLTNEATHDEEKIHS